jgi:hypothetical protein
VPGDHDCVPATRQTVGTCARADRPDEPAAPVTVAICWCGGAVFERGPKARQQPGPESAESPYGTTDDAERLRDAMRRKMAGQATAEDVAAAYQEKLGGHRARQAAADRAAMAEQLRREAAAEAREQARRGQR